MKIKSTLLLFYFLTLAYLTGEILVRRWLFEQLPSQLPTWLVYGLVFGNACVLWHFARAWINERRPQAPIPM